MAAGIPGAGRNPGHPGPELGPIAGISGIPRSRHQSPELRSGLVNPDVNEFRGHGPAQPVQAGIGRLGVTRFVAFFGAWKGALSSKRSENHSHSIVPGGFDV